MIFLYFRVISNPVRYAIVNIFESAVFLLFLPTDVQKHALLHFNFTPLSFASAVVSARARTDPIILPSDKNDCR